jgi:hypothetical protein
VGGCGLDAFELGEGPVTGCCDHCNGTSGSIKGGGFPD